MRRRDTINLRTPPELLSDHPNNAYRIAQLEAHFKQNPATLVQFDANSKSATHFTFPANEAAQFLR